MSDYHEYDPTHDPTCCWGCALARMEMAEKEVKRLKAELMRLRVLFCHTASVLTSVTDIYDFSGDEETDMIQYWHDRMKDGGA